MSQTKQIPQWIIAICAVLTLIFGVYQYSRNISNNESIKNNSSKPQKKLEPFKENPSVGEVNKPKLNTENIPIRQIEVVENDNFENKNNSNPIKSNKDKLIRAKSYHEEDMMFTSWKYIDEDAMYNLIFNEGGKLISKNPADETIGNDKWRIEDNFLIFSFNEEYSNYKGRFLNDSEVNGIGEGKNGQTWDFKLLKN